jgi:hypothetical protein
MYKAVYPFTCNRNRNKIILQKSLKCTRIVGTKTVGTCCTILIEFLIDFLLVMKD